MKRDLYLALNVDLQRMREYALQRAKQGDDVTLHAHVYGPTCKGRACEKVSNG